MFKVELEFDTSLSKETVNRYCKDTDKIFTNEGVTIAEKSFGKELISTKPTMVLLI